MQGKKNIGPDINLEEKSTSVFAQYYNQNIPAQFPRVSVEILETFKGEHPELFKGAEQWTIDKHRKRLMDWLTSVAR